MGGSVQSSNQAQQPVQQPLQQAPPQLPTDLAALSENMMQRGRPSFDWSMMGDVADLAGQVEQPLYTTPPPQYMAEFWRNWEKGQSVDGAPFPFSGRAP